VSPLAHDDTVLAHDETVLAHYGTVLAHYGGAPEALTVALPVAIFAGFLLMERRARRRERESAAPERQDGGPDSGLRRS
jgi:hypothetical protein